MKRFAVRDMTATALMAAVLCVVAPFSLPVGVIPLSLASLVVLLSPALLGTKRGVTAILLYILIGAIGLPVFSGFRGGIGVLAGPTGGFIVGYLFCGLIVGLCCDRWRGKWLAYPLAMIAGTAALYVFGTAWLVVSSGTSLSAAVALCVTPFLLGDAVKITAATLIAYPLRKILIKQGLI